MHTLLRVIAAGAVALAGAGCGIVPVPSRRVAGPVLSDTALRGIEIGRTASDEVVRALGQPQAVSADRRLLVYRSAASSYTLAWVLPRYTPSGRRSSQYGTTRVWKTQNLLVEFDEHDRARWAGILSDAELLRKITTHAASAPMAAPLLPLEATAEHIRNLQEAHAGLLSLDTGSVVFREPTGRHSFRIRTQDIVELSTVHIRVPGDPVCILRFGPGKPTTLRLRLNPQALVDLAAHVARGSGSAARP